jgi:hypothetical protein
MAGGVMREALSEMEAALVEHRAHFSGGLADWRSRNAGKTAAINDRIGAARTALSHSVMIDLTTLDNERAINAVKRLMVGVLL